MSHRIDSADPASSENGRPSVAGNGRVSETSASFISPRKILWPILLSLVVLGAIGYFTFEPDEFRQVVDRINPWLMAAALGTVVLRVYFGGLRLNFISRGRLGRAAGLRGQLAWDFFSNVTPSAIGGAPFAAVYVARDKQISVGESTAFMLFSMLLDQLWFALTIPIVIVASMYMEVIPGALGDVGTAGFMLYFCGMLGWVVLFGYATLFRPDVLQHMASRVFRIRWLRRFHDRVEHSMRQLGRRAKILRSQPAAFYVKGFLLTIGTWASRYLLLLFIVWSFYEEFDKILLLFRTAAMTLGSLIMPTPGGAGGIEALYALFIGTLIPSAALAPTLLAWRFLGYYLFVGLGVFLTTHHVQKAITRTQEGDLDVAGDRSVFAAPELEEEVG